MEYLLPSQESLLLPGDVILLVSQEVIQPFRVIIHRCHRYYFHTGKQTFEAVPSMPADFHHTLAAKSRQARTLFHQSSQLADDPDLRVSPALLIHGECAVPAFCLTTSSGTSWMFMT